MNIRSSSPLRGIYWISFQILVDFQLSLKAFKSSFKEIKPFLQNNTHTCITKIVNPRPLEFTLNSFANLLDNTTSKSSCIKLIISRRFSKTYITDDKD